MILHVRFELSEQRADGCPTRLTRNPRNPGGVFSRVHRPLECRSWQFHHCPQSLIPVRVHTRPLKETPTQAVAADRHWDTPNLRPKSRRGRLPLQGASLKGQSDWSAFTALKDQKQMPNLSYQIRSVWASFHGNRREGGNWMTTGCLRTALTSASFHRNELTDLELKFG